jgi:hypothetical protein
VSAGAGEPGGLLPVAAGDAAHPKDGIRLMKNVILNPHEDWGKALEESRSRNLDPNKVFEFIGSHQPDPFLRNLTKGDESGDLSTKITTVPKVHI